MGGKIEVQPSTEKEIVLFDLKHTAPNHVAECFGGGHMVYVEELRYHKNWGDVMRVIEEIRDMMPDIKMPRDLEALKNGTHGSEKYIDILALPISSKIEEVCKATVAFINWYNSQSVTA